MTKIAIVGTAPASRAMTPWGDTTWQMWVCAPGNMGKSPRVDAWFELHALDALCGPEHRSWSQQYLGWLRAQSFPVWMQERNDLVPQALIFPRDLMITKFGRLWFSSTITWMMAKAIADGADEIGLFGVDMAADQEHYTGQRSGCWRFIEICKERGIKVTIPKESCLGALPALYGYSEATLMGRKLYVRLDELRRNRAEQAAILDKTTRDIHFLDGCIEDCSYMIRTFLDGAEAELDMGAAPEPRPPEQAPRPEDFVQHGLLLVPAAQGMDAKTLAARPQPPLPVAPMAMEPIDPPTDDLTRTHTAPRTNSGAHHQE